MSTVQYPHIEFNPDRVPVISGTTTKVIEIVQDHLAHHWDADAIHRQHPHLSMAEIHAALTYYYDHEEEIEREIDLRFQRVGDIRSRRADDNLQEKLRSSSKSP